MTLMASTNIKEFVSSIIRESLESNDAVEPDFLEERAKLMAKDFSDDDYFFYRSKYKTSQSAFVSYCEVKFHEPPEIVQSIINEVIEKAGIQYDKSPILVNRLENSKAESEVFSSLRNFVFKQLDLNRPITGLEYFIKSALATTGIFYLMILFELGVWNNQVLLFSVFIPYTFFASIQRINMLRSGNGTAFLSMATIIGLAYTRFCYYFEYEPNIFWYMLDVIFCILVLAGLPKWVLRTFDEAQE